MFTDKNGRESPETLFISSCTAKQNKRRKTNLVKAANKLGNSSKGETRVNIGVTVQRWRQLMESKVMSWFVSVGEM